MTSTVSDFVAGRRPSCDTLDPWVIETCAPERYLDTKPPWTEVERWMSAEAASDSLRAPCFSWEPFLLARIRKGTWEYTIGAFDAEAFVDLGVHSKAKKIHRWNRPGAARFAATRSWPDAWSECQNATWMLSVANGVISRASMTLAACACARKVLELVPPGATEFSNALDAAEGWARGLIFTDDATPLAASLFERAAYYAGRDTGGLYASHACYAIAYAVGTIGNRSYAREVPGIIEMTRSTRRGRWTSATVQRELAELVRDAVPFRDVIEGLVRGEPR